MRTEIDPESGEVTCWRVREIVADDEEIEDPEVQMPIGEARAIQPDAEIGTEIVLGELDTAREYAQTAREVAERGGGLAAVPCSATNQIPGSLSPLERSF